LNQLPTAVFLDRDGTVIEDAHYLSKPEQAKLIEGRHPVREGGPDERLERRAVRDEVEGVRVRLAISW